jgi:hypothetical protein
MSGTIQMGIVNSWDPATMTAEVTAFDGSAHHYNVGVMMQSCDIGNGVYSFTPPSIGAPCMFTKVSGETMILGQYAPPNLGGNEDISSTTGSTLNRSVEEMPNADHLPGDQIMTSQSGAQVYLRNMVYGIEMSPIFYSIWNLMNSVWDTMCNIFKFSAPAADILVDVDGSGSTNVDISVRRSAGERNGTPAINLNMGANAGVINLKINGQSFLHVDIERNVTLNVKKMTVIGDEVNMLGVQDVKLP